MASWSSKMKTMAIQPDKRFNKVRIFGMCSFIFIMLIHISSKDKDIWENAIGQIQMDLW